LLYFGSSLDQNSFVFDCERQENNKKGSSKRGREWEWGKKGEGGKNWKREAQRVNNSGKMKKMNV
jgi:hypothetical protein